MNASRRSSTSGTTFLFTHNALEVLGARIRNDDMGYDVAGVGMFELESTLRMFGRYNGKVMGVVAEAGPAHPVRRLQIAVLDGRGGRVARPVS